MIHPKHISNSGRLFYKLICLCICLFSVFQLSASSTNLNRDEWLKKLKITVDKWSEDWEKQNPQPSKSQEEATKKRKEKRERDYRNFLSETFLNFRHNLYPSQAEDIALEQENHIWDDYTPQKGYNYLFKQYADRTASELQTEMGNNPDSLNIMLQKRDAFRLTRQMKDLALQLELKQPEALRSVITHMENSLNMEIPEKTAYMNAVNRLEQRKRAWLDDLNR